MSILSILLPIIDFEGTIVKPTKAGVYMCPFGCGDKRFSAPKWKTEKGFRKHMESCGARPSTIRARQEREEVYNEERTHEKEAALAACTRNIGDTIFYVYEVITKPTHKQRGNRMVRVQYEAEKVFGASKTIIKSINWNGGIYYNEGIIERRICATMEEAETRAQEAKKSYDGYVAFSSSCR